MAWGRCASVLLAAAVSLLAAGASSGSRGAAGAAPSLPYSLTVVGRFDGPVHVTAPPGDERRLFVVEKRGTVRVLLDGRPLPRPFLDLRDEVEWRGNEQGLLSLALAPDYRRSGLLYVYYVDEREDARVVEYRRARSTPSRADPGTRRELLRIEHPSGEHYGGLLAFGPGGHLYLSVGDGGLNRGRDPLRAQRPDDVHGKIVRIDRRTGGTRVVARGLRNPWRYWFDRETGDLWIGDAGEWVRESIDYVPARKVRGANLGWPCFEGGLAKPEYPARLCEGALPPLYEYAREGGNCSVIGGLVVRDPRLPGLAGRYLFADFCLGEVISLRLRRGALAGVRSLRLYIPTVTSFGEDARRRVHVTTLGGRVYRLDPRRRPAAGKAPPPSGRELYLAAGCGTCHALAAAGTTGTNGPSLDEARPGRALVVERVTRGKGRMPAYGNRLGAAEIARLADFVARSAREPAPAGDSP